MFYNKYLIFGKYMDNFRENKFFALFFQKMGFWDYLCKRAQSWLNK